MKIIKRNGTLEQFNLSKIRTSIENSAYDCSYSLNESDINLLQKSINERINSLHIPGRCCSSLEVRIIIYEELKRNNFVKVAHSYLDTNM